MKLFFPSNSELLYGVSALHPASLLAAFQQCSTGKTTLEGIFLQELRCLMEAAVVPGAGKPDHGQEQHGCRGGSSSRICLG